MPTTHIHTYIKAKLGQFPAIHTNNMLHHSSSSFLSFPHESYVRQIVLSQCLAQPMAMPLTGVRSLEDQAVFISIILCCMVCLMLHSQVSGSFVMFSLLLVVAGFPIRYIGFPGPRRGRSCCAPLNSSYHPNILYIG